MNPRAFNYFMREGMRSFFKNGLMSIASVVTVTMCLILFGIYLIFSINLNYTAENLKSSYEVYSFIDEEAASARIKQIEGELAAMQNVNEVTFVSKEEAFENWKSRQRDPEALAGFENDNPLRDSYKITFLNLELVNDTVKEIEALDGVAYVRNYKDIIEEMIKVTSTVKNVSLWFMVFFALISVFIISNAIRITVFARRREVNIMKFVGATDLFISLPFIIEGIIVGLIGAFISSTIALQGYHVLTVMWDSSPGASSGMLDSVLASSIQLYPSGAIAWIISGALLCFGVVLGAAGSALSLRRHLYV